MTNSQEDRRVAAMTRWFVTVAGRDLEVVASSPPADVGTLVLLHDGLGSCDSWHDFPHQLARTTNHRIVLFSRHGHGRSAASPFPRGPDFLHIQAREVLPALLKTIDVRRFLLLGHSDGATIALLHSTSSATPKPAGIVAIAPHVFFEPRCREGLATARQDFVNGQLATRLQIFHGTNTPHVFWNWYNMWSSPAFETWDIRHDLAATTSPILAIQSAADPYGTTAQLRAIQEHVAGPHEVVVVDGQSHAPHLQPSTNLVATIARFALSCT